MYYDQITDFIFREDQPQKSDYIFIPGSGYGELAIKAAQLYRDGYAKKIVVSGKYSILHDAFQGPLSPVDYRGRSYATESDFLTEVLMDGAVKREDILQETQATFTYENAVYTRRLLEKKDGLPDKAILVCQAFHGARALMYYQYVFPKTIFYVCPAQTQGISKENWFLQDKGIQTVLGEVKRIGTQFADMMGCHI